MTMASRCPKPSPASGPGASRGTGYFPWHRLLMRVIGIDVLTCQKCQGKRTIIAFIQDPVVARDILVHLGLTTPQVQHHRSRRRGVRRSRSSSCSVHSSASSPRRTVNSPAAAK